jgi:nitrogen fixation protein FixH
MKSRRTLWPFVPPAMLIVMVGGLLALAHVAADDPGFSVEKDYYKKAIAWDAQREQERQNARLGWKLDVETRRDPNGGVALEAALVDRNGARVERAKIDVEAFHNARAADVLLARLDEGGAGYRAALPMRRAGVWELRFTATRGSDKFTRIVRTEIPRESVQ